MRLLVPLILLLTLFAACSSDDSPAAAWPTRTITVASAGRSQQLTVEIASTPTERQQGLMLRQSLDPDWGMLFLFPAESQGGFWMKDTYIPLTIAYLAADGTVLELRDGIPLDQTVLAPLQPYRYVLEVNHGWFTRHGLGPGARVQLPGDLPAAR